MSIFLYKFDVVSDILFRISDVHHLSLYSMTSSEKIKQYALSLGFDACGICRAESSGEEANLREWIRLNYQGDMSYLERNIEKTEKQEEREQWMI